MSKSKQDVGYACSVEGNGTLVWLHEVITEDMGLDVSKGIVHESGDTLDNRRCNLREALPGEEVPELARTIFDLPHEEIGEMMDQMSPQLQSIARCYLRDLDRARQRASSPTHRTVAMSAARTRAEWGRMRQARREGRTLPEVHCELIDEHGVLHDVQVDDADAKRVLEWADAQVEACAGNPQPLSALAGTAVTDRATGQRVVLCTDIKVLGQAIEATQAEIARRFGVPVEEVL